MAPKVNTYSSKKSECSNNDSSDTADSDASSDCSSNIRASSLRKPVVETFFLTCNCGCEEDAPRCDMITCHNCTQMILRSCQQLQCRDCLDKNLPNGLRVASSGFDETSYVAGRPTSSGRISMQRITTSSRAAPRKKT